MRLKLLRIFYGLVGTSVISAATLRASSPPGRVVAWGYPAFAAATNPIAGLSDVVAVSAGSVNEVVMRSNGSLVSVTSSLLPLYVPVGLSNVVAISCGGIDVFDHNLALRNDGTVVAWGMNSEGQTDVPAWLSNVVAISAGGWHNLALRKDGTVVSWGYNAYGQTNVPPSLNGVTAVEAGDYHSLALRTNGTVVAWGRNDKGQASVPLGLSGTSAIAAGGRHSLALSTNGTVTAWGAGKQNNGISPEYGQSIIPAGLTNVIAIAAGSSHSLVLRSDGTVVSWGYNHQGQTNTPVGLTNVMYISAGWTASLAITAPRVPVALEFVGPNPVLHFHTFAGQQYSVEFAPGLGAGVWTPLPGGTVQGDGHAISISDTNPAATSRLYRVMRTQ